MVTQFGRFCKKLRIDYGEVMADMASKLGVSPAFLSKVENGKKKPPRDWEAKISELYNLSSNQKKELEESIYKAINSDCIDMTSYDTDERELMLSFARKIKGLDIENIRKRIFDGDSETLEKTVFQKILEEISQEE